MTTFLPTDVTSSLEDLGRFADTVRGWMPEASTNGAELLGFNIEGPFIAPSKAGAQNPSLMRQPSTTLRADLTPLLAGLRMMTVAREVDGACAVIGWLRETGVTVALGHSNASAYEANAGYDAGARGTTHLFNAMSGVTHHGPGLAAVALARDDVAVELIADGLHVDPLLWSIIVRSKPANGVILVSDALSLAGMAEGRTRLGALEVEVRNEACRLVSDGRLAGSVIALDGAVRNLVRAGVGVQQAVAAASRNPCDLLGLNDRGRLSPGCRADLVLLDDELHVVRVMRAGAWQPGAGRVSDSTL